MGLLAYWYSLILFVISNFAKGFGHFNVPYRPPSAPPASRAPPSCSFRPSRFGLCKLGLCFYGCRGLHWAIPPPDICFHLLPTIRHRFGLTNLLSLRRYFHWHPTRPLWTITECSALRGTCCWWITVDTSPLQWAAYRGGASRWQKQLYSTHLNSFFVKRVHFTRICYAWNFTIMDCSNGIL